MFGPARWAGCQPIQPYSPLRLFGLRVSLFKPGADTQNLSCTLSVHFNLVNV